MVIVHPGQVGEGRCLVTTFGLSLRHPRHFALTEKGRRLAYESGDNVPERRQ